MTAALDECMPGTLKERFTLFKVLIVSLWLGCHMCSSVFGDPPIKQSNVSGQFYESDPKRLSTEIDGFFSAAVLAPSQKRVEIIIAPHAGYVYSGAVAAYGFKAAGLQTYHTVVILAPSHYSGFNGISVWEHGGFQTPLGVAEVDSGFAKALIAANPKFYFDPEVFEKEHSLEVEIPFLQKTFSNFKIVPVIMGQPDFQLLDEFAQALQDIIGGRRDVLVVVSTDLSHYHEDAVARAKDLRAIEALKGLKARQVWEQCSLRAMEMCGYVPVTAALLYAKRKGLSDTKVLRYANSGDVSGDLDRVVGYVSMVVFESEGPAESQEKEKESQVSLPLTFNQKKRLIEIARETVNLYVRTGRAPDVKEADARLSMQEGAFVTIHKNGLLRGCIGNIIGQKPLYLTVLDVAVSSATQDPRFAPVKANELEEIDVEVSVLSRPRMIKDVGEIELGIHGVIVSRGPGHYGVFLPQVAKETGWTKEEFLSELCAQKAGLPENAWKDPETKIEIFSAQVFSEEDIRRGP